MDNAVILAIVIAVTSLLLAMIPLILNYQKKQNSTTQRDISDRELLRLLHREPDQLISPHLLSEKTGITLNQARNRLNALFMYGILNRSQNSKGRYFFGFREELQEGPQLVLSPDPFLTVEDLLQIFSAHDNRVSPQELIMATGLPLEIIKREMKYFEQEGIVQKLSRLDAMGTMQSRFFVLQEPYRSDPDKFRQRAGVMDLEMRELLRNDNLIV